MAMSKGIQMKAALVLGLALFLYEVEGRASRGLASGGPAVFDVTKYGAKGDGKLEVGSEEDDYPINSMAFIRTWLEACNSSGPAKVIIPPGKFVTGQVFFRGPCKSPAITVEVQGNVVPASVPTYFPTPEWFHIYDVTGVTLTGTGTFDAQGREGSWNRYECLTNPNCPIPPPSISLYRVTNSVIDGIKSVNTLSYHIHVSDSRGVTIRNVNLHSPATHILTKGVDVLNSSDVNVVNSVIGAGNDCITFGRGSTNVSAVGITCGPGLGISVGNLGNEFGGADVKGVQVRNCTFRGTMNGARVRSLPGREPSKVSGIVFEDLVMDNVKNPIIIEEGNANQSSNAKISDVIFRNIKGTSATSSVVSFKCNKLFPCEGVQVIDVDVKPLAPGKQLPAAACSNTKVVFGGLHAGLAC